MNENEFIQKVQQGFDEASEGYDNPAMRFFDHAAHNLVDLALLQGDECILDLATGTGKVAIEAACRLNRGQVTAIDLSRGMLERAKANANKKGLCNITFRQGDINRAEFPERFFDGVFCGFGMFFFSDMHKVLQRLSPWLKTGSLIAMTSFADGSFRPLSDLTLNRFKNYGINLPDSYTWQRLDTPQKHFELLDTAGFKQIRSETKQVGYYLKDAYEWWDLVRYTGFRTFLNQLTPHQAEQYRKEHVAEINKQANANGIWLNVNVIFTMAFRS